MSPWPRRGVFRGEDYAPSGRNPFTAGFQLSSTDETVRSFIEQFASREASRQDRLRRKLSTRDLDLLFSYCHRCVEHAVWDGATAPAMEGVEALAAVDATRMDPRDLHSVIYLLAWALEWLGESAEEGFREGAERAQSETAQIMRQTAAQASADPHQAGVHVVGINGGQILIDWEGNDYSPDKDLIAIAIRLSDVLDRDRYVPNRIQAAERLPAVWFRGYPHQHGVGDIPGIRGCVLVGASRGGRDIPTEDQQVMLWIAEASSEESAEDLAAAATTSNDSREAIGVQRGRVVTALVQRSYLANRRPAERSGALERLRDPIEKSLTAGKTIA